MTLPGDMFLFHKHILFKKAMGILLMPPSVFPSICPSDRSSVCPSTCVLKLWTLLSVRHAPPPKPLGRILPKLATTLPLMVRVCKSSIIFLCIHSSVWQSFLHLSVTLSPKALDKFNQTCYITSPHGKGV